MNKILVFAIIIFSFLAACKKETLESSGLSASISPNSFGNTNFYIDSKPQLLHLKGSISLTYGKLEIILINSEGEIVYLNLLKAPIELTLNLPLKPATGKWELSYKSINGDGEISLYLTNK